MRKLVSAMMILCMLLVCFVPTAAFARSKKIPYPWKDELPEGAVVKDEASDLIASTRPSIELFEERKFEDPSAKITELTYYIYDPTQHGFPADRDYPVSVWFHGSGMGVMGTTVIPMVGAGTMAFDKYQQEIGGMYLIVPLANSDIEEWSDSYVDVILGMIKKRTGS